MKGVGLGRNSGKYLTSPLVSRLNEKLFDYCDEILDVRDKIYEIYEVLQKYENTEKHRRYCSRIIKAVDSPITTMRFTIAREQIEKIKKSLDRFTNVEYQIIECQRVINLLDIPIRTRIMFCDTQLKKLYQCIKIRDYSKKQRWSSTFKKD